MRTYSSQIRKLNVIVVAAVLAGTAVAGCQQANAPAPIQVPRVEVSTQPRQMTWSAEVDDSATVFIQGGKTWSDYVSGKGVDNVTSTFLATLPSSPVTVKLASHQGRGTVALIQQPTRDNNYTAAVRVLDPEVGKDHYQFTLTW